MTFNSFFAEVVDVNDPEHGGRVKIRVFGDQDDKSNIPDDKLRWARPVFPITNPIKSKVGTPVTGLMKGSRVWGFYADQDKQIPYVMGSIGSTGRFGSLTDTANTPRDIPTPVANGLPSSGGASWPVGDLRLLFNNGAPRLDVQSIIKFAEGMAGTGPARNANTPTIATQNASGSSALDFVKKIDPNNLSGALGKDIFSLLKNFQNSPFQKFTSMVGGQQLINSVNEVVNKLFNQNNNSQQDDKRILIETLLNMINNLMMLKRQSVKNVDAVNNILADIEFLNAYPDEVYQIKQVQNILNNDNFDVITDQIIMLMKNLISKIGQ